MANVNANINVNINTQQASAQLRKLSADISRFNQQSFAANSAAAQQQRALNQALIDGVRTSGQFRTSIVPITSAVDRFATSIEKGQLSLGQYTRYAASQLPGMRRIFTREFDMINRVATSRVKTLNTQFVALGDSVGGAQKALAMTPVALDQYSSRAAVALQRTQIFNRLLRDGSTQLLNWGKNTQWAGRQLMVGFTIPLGILGAQAAKVFKELEAEAVNFRKVYGDMFTTDVEVEKNLQAVKELATEMTKYGISIQQSMELANVAAQSGARGQDLISQTTEATRLAVLGQMEQQEAIRTTITLQNAFQMSNEELTESINFLNIVENQSVLSLQNVTEAIPRVAPVIKSLGGDVKDLSVMLVAMREGGVSAAEGANALKTSLARLVSPTAGAVKMAEKFGINLQNIVVENKGDILGAVMELADAMKVLDDLSQQQLMSEIFGKRQYARIGALFNNITNEASQAQRVLELTTMSTRDLAATAERELGAVEESVSAKFTGAMERAKLALAPVGEEFLKALTPVVDFVGKILSKFADLPDGIKTAIVAATGIIGGLAPIILMVTGLVANGIANIGKFILFLRKQVATLRGNGEAFKMYSSAELEAAAAAASLEGKTSSLTTTMHLQKPAIETLITLYTRLAASARSAAAAMPATMGGVGVPTAAAAAATRGGGFAAVAPKLPVAYRNTGGAIFESASGKTRVPGSGNTDTVPAMLTPGEFVINKKATRENLPLIKAINDGKIGGSQSSTVPMAAEGIQYANIGLLMQGLRRISGSVRPRTPSGKVFPKWFYDTSTGTNITRQRMALEDSYQMGMRPKKPSGAEYSLDEIRSMKNRDISRIWKGVQKGHMAPSVSVGEKTDFLPGIMGPMLGGGKGGNLSMIRGGNPKEIYDMFSSLEARGIHPMSIMFGAAKELGYATNPGLFMRTYNDIMQGLLVKRTNFGTGETFESWAYRIIKRNLGSLNNKDGNFIERISSVGTVRGIDPMRSMKGGEYQSGRGSLYAAMLPSFNKGGMIPGVQYLMGGAQVLSRAEQIRRIRQTDVLNRKIEDQSLASLFNLRFNDVKDASSPSSFVKGMFSRWDKTPTRVSPKESTAMLLKGKKPRYPQVSQEEYLADMIISANRFSDVADVFKPITVGKTLGRGEARVFDGHTRIHAQTVMGLIESQLGRKVSSMSKDEIIEAIRLIRQRSLADELTDDAILSSVANQRVLTKEASRRDIDRFFDHPLKAKPMQSMYNFEGRTLIPGIHDREIEAIVGAASRANFYGVKKDSQSLMRSMGFVSLGDGDRFRYDPKATFKDRTSYQRNIGRKIIDDLIDTKSILPLQRNKGGIIPGVQYLSLGGVAQLFAQQRAASQRSANASRFARNKKPADMNEQEYNNLVSSIYTKGTVDDATGYTRPTFRMGKNNEELVFAGFGENVAGLQAAGRQIRTVPTTPEGLIREALRLKPNDPRLTRMLANFENNTITKKELRLLDNIVAATAITKQGTLSPVEKTSGFAMVLASLTGDSRANSVLSFKRSSLYKNVQTQQQKELQNQLRMSSARQSDAVNPDQVAAMHMTKHSIQRDKNGNIVLHPAGQYNIGTDKAVPRSSIHMTLDAPVESHMWGTWDDTMKTIVTPLSQVGKVQNLNPTDTWKLLNPGEALRLSKASVVEPYTDALAYQRVIEKRGLAERGAKPPIVVDDPISGEVMYLLKQPGSYTEQDRIDILRMQGRPESVAKNLAPTLVGKEAEELKALALQTAKRQVGIDTPLQRISGWGLTNSDAQARMDALAASRGIPRGIHQGTRVADLERSGFESNYMSLDNPYNRFTGPELAAYRMTARHGHFKTQGETRNKYGGGIDDILSESPRMRNLPEGNTGGLLVSSIGGKNSFYRNKGGIIPGVQYLRLGGLLTSKFPAYSQQQFSSNPDALYHAGHVDPRKWKVHKYNPKASVAGPGGYAGGSATQISSYANKKSRLGKKRGVFQFYPSGGFANLYMPMKRVPVSFVDEYSQAMARQAKKYKINPNKVLLDPNPEEDLLRWTSRMRKNFKKQYNKKHKIGRLFMPRRANKKSLLANAEGFFGAGYQGGFYKFATRGVDHDTVAYTILKPPRTVSKLSQSMFRSTLADEQSTLGRGFNMGGFISPTLKMNKGNRVPGTGNTDTVPAMLTPGEFVVNKEASQKNLPLLHAINDGKTQFLNDGGGAQAANRSMTMQQHVDRLAQRQRRMMMMQIAEAEYAAKASSRVGGVLQVDRAHDVMTKGPKSFAANPYEVPAGSKSAWRAQSHAENEFSKTMAGNSERALKEQQLLRKAMIDSGQKQESVEKIMKKVERGTRLQYGETQAVAKGIEKMDKAQRTQQMKEFSAAAKARAEFRKGSTAEARAAKTLVGGVPRGFTDWQGRIAQNTPNIKEPENKKLLAARERSTAAERAMAIRKETGISRKDALAQARKELRRARAARIEERKQLLRGKGMSWKEAARIAIGQEDKEQRRYEKRRTDTNNERRRRARSSTAGKGGGRVPPTTPGTAGAEDPDIPPKQSRFARANAAVGKFGMGAGMGLSMAGMLPMMNQDEQGKFMGMDANTAMMGMMGGGTLLSLAPMMGKLALPIMAAAAAIGGVALTAKILSDRMRETAEKAAEFGANVGGTENSLNTISQLFNEKTPVQRSTQMQLQFSAEEQEKSFGEFQNYLGSEFGQQFLKDFENLTGAQRFTKLSDYIRSGIAAGVFGREQAISFAKIVGSALNDAVLGSSVIAEIRQRDPQEGSAGLIQLAEKRRKAVEEESRVVAESSEIVGAGIQILQDYSNAVALATEEFADGKITYEEFSEIAQKAKMSQETYSGAIQETLLEENRKNKLVTDVSVTPAFYKEMSKILTEEQLKALKEATTKGGPAIGGKDRQAFEGYALTQFASAMGSGMDPDQAIAMLTEIRENPEGDLGRMYSRRLAAGEENILPIIGFEQTADVMAETLGMTDGLNAAFKNLGKTFHEAGGNIGEFQAFITNLPEKLRGSMIRSMQSMTPEARQRIVSGATQISGAYGESAGRVFASTAYQASVQRARGTIIRDREQQGPGGGVTTRKEVTEEDLKQIKDVENAYLDLQRDFGTEKALEINIAATTLQSGQEVDPAKWAKDARAISRQIIEMEKNFPPEIYSRLNIDFTDPKEIEMWNRSSKVFKDNVLTISQLNPNIDINAVLRFLTLDADGNELTPEQIADNVIALNKAWKTLETSDDVEVRRKAMMTIVTAYQDENGNLLDPEKAQANMKELEKKFGGRVYELSPDFIYMSLQAKINADELNRQAESIETQLKDGIEDPEMRRVLKAKAMDLRNAAAAVETRTNSSVRAAIGDLPKGGAGGGGGGGAAQQSPVEGFIENILNQFKMWTDASAKMKDLNNARKNFVQNVLKGDSIFKKLNKAVGFDPARLQEILGMGPEGAKEFLDKYVKDGTLTKAGKNILDAATQAGIGQTIGGNVIATAQAESQRKAGAFLSRRGEGSQVIQSIAGDPQKAAELLRLRKEYNKSLKGGNEKDIKQAEKALNRYINSERKLVRTAKEREEALKSASEKAIEGNNDIIEANNKYMQEGDRHFEREQRNIERNYRDRIKSSEDQIESLNDQIDEVNKLIEAEEKLNRADQDRIRDLQRQQEMLSRQLEELERANELDERRIETLSREDEIRNRTAEALNRELELMSRAEEDIRKSYQDRIEALDEVAKVNDYIINQQRQQIDLSRAISEGDIYAATAAAQEMRASSASFAVEQVRSGLEQGMENQVEGLRTSEGLTREQAEERIRGIEDQSYQTSLQIRDIEDQIYERNLQMIPIKDQIRNYDMQIRDIQDDIYDRETVILDLQNQRLEPLQTSLRNQEEILDKLNKQVETEIEAIEFRGMGIDQWTDTKLVLNDQNESLQDQNKLLAEEDERLAGLSKKWNNIANQIRQANKFAQEGMTDVKAIAASEIEQISANTELSSTERAEAIKAANKERQKRLKEIEAEREAKTSELLASGSNLGAYAGGLMKYAMGGIANPRRFTSNEAPPVQKRARGGGVFGNGSRDSIPAMLTPGEFVVRKAMVDKYGVPMMQALNQGSFAMPRYDTGRSMETGVVAVTNNSVSNISAPVYNTYDMKFSINGTNQSADEIANTVMFKMRQLQNQSIRSNRGY